MSEALLRPHRNMLTEKNGILTKNTIGLSLIQRFSQNHLINVFQTGFAFSLSCEIRATTVMWRCKPNRTGRTFVTSRDCAFRTGQPATEYERHY
jgi:hypothetical protein